MSGPMMVLLDGRVMSDVAIRLTLGACGLVQAKIDELMSSKNDNSDEISRIIQESGISSREGALKFSVAAKCLIYEFLEMTGCPDHAVQTNAAFILENMSSSSVQIPGVTHRATETKKPEL